MLAEVAAIQKNNYGLSRPSDLAWRTKALVILNDKMEKIMKIVKSREVWGLLIKVISETIKMKKRKKGMIPSNLISNISC